MRVVLLVFVGLVSTLVAVSPGKSRVLAQSRSKWTLAEGDSVPSVILGRGRDGKPASFAFGSQGKPTVVYVISPFSPFVTANENRFASLMQQAGKKFSWLLLSPSENRFDAYFDKVRPTLPLLSMGIAGIPPDVKAAMMLGGYPQTLVIDSNSRVLKNFMGAYDLDSISAKPHEINRYFGIKLPSEAGR